MYSLRILISSTKTIVQLYNTILRSFQIIYQQINFIWFHSKVNCMWHTNWSAAINEICSPLTCNHNYSCLKYICEFMASEAVPKTTEGQTAFSV